MARLKKLRRLPAAAAAAAANAAHWTRRNIEDVALVGGYALIATGCFWIFGPAGLIVGGILSAGTALRSARAGHDELVDDEPIHTPERERRPIVDDELDEDT